MKIRAIQSYQSSVTPKQNIQTNPYVTNKKNDSVTFSGLNLIRITNDQPKKKGQLIKLFIDNFFGNNLAKKSKLNILNKIKKDMTTEIKKNALINQNNTPCTDIMMLSENNKIKGGFSLFITEKECRINFITVSPDLIKNKKDIEAFFIMGNKIKQICKSRKVSTITCEADSKDKNYIKSLEKLGLKIKSGFQIKMMEADIDRFI